MPCLLSGLSIYVSPGAYSPHSCIFVIAGYTDQTDFILLWSSCGESSSPPFLSVFFLLLSVLICCSAVTVPGKITGTTIGLLYITHIGKPVITVTKCMQIFVPKVMIFYSFLHKLSTLCECGHKHSDIRTQILKQKVTNVKMDYCHLHRA